MIDSLLLLDSAQYKGRFYITTVGVLLGLERFLDELEDRRILLEERLARLIISTGQVIPTLPLDDLRLSCVSSCSDQEQRALPQIIGLLIEKKSGTFAISCFDPPAHIVPILPANPPLPAPDRIVCRTSAGTMTTNLTIIDEGNREPCIPPQERI
jgi:hypothetical protein